MNDVLIVDDAKDLLEFFPFFLERHKIACYTASSTWECYEQLKLNTPAVILLDVMLGLEDGRAFCKALKTDIGYKHIPIILMSASPARLTDYKKVMADDILEKPFDIDMLMDKIKKFMTGAAK